MLVLEIATTAQGKTVEEKDQERPGLNFVLVGFLIL